MKTPEERYALALEIMEWLLEKKGQRIYIQDALTDRDYDRHGTSNISFSMILEDAMVRFSGGRAMLFGTDKELYEFAIDRIDGTVSVEQLELVEVLDKRIDKKYPLLRSTIISLK